MKDVEIGTDEFFYGEYYPFTVPNSIQDARSAPDAALWETAIQNEINSVFQNNTLSEPMILPEGKRATKLKILLSLKFDKDGNVDRYKARMVFQHVKRICPVDCERIFAPVVDKVTVRLFLSQAAVHKMQICYKWMLQQHFIW